MAEKREWMKNQKDWLKAHRWQVCYALLVAVLGGSVVSWGLLPQRVAMALEDGVPARFLDKNTAVLSHLVLGLLFTGLFARWPRELVYLVAALLSLFLMGAVLYINLGVAV